MGDLKDLRGGSNSVEFLQTKKIKERRGDVSDPSKPKAVCPSST